MRTRSQPEHVCVATSTCDDGWHNYGGWSTPYTTCRPGTADDDPTLVLPGSVAPGGIGLIETGEYWQERRCQIHGCRAGQWRRAEPA